MMFLCITGYLRTTTIGDSEFIAKLRHLYAMSAPVRRRPKFITCMTIWYRERGRENVTDPKHITE